MGSTPKPRKKRDIFCSNPLRFWNRGPEFGAIWTYRDPARNGCARIRKKTFSEVARLRELHSLTPSFSRRHFLKAMALLGLEGRAVISFGHPLLTGSVASGQP